MVVPGLASPEISAMDAGNSRGTKRSCAFAIVADAPTIATRNVKSHIGRKRQTATSNCAAKRMNFDRGTKSKLCNAMARYFPEAQLSFWSHATNVNGSFPHFMMASSTLYPRNNCASSRPPRNAIMMRRTTFFSGALLVEREGKFVLWMSRRPSDSGSWHLFYSIL